MLFLGRMISKIPNQGQEEGEGFRIALFWNACKLRLGIKINLKTQALILLYRLSFWWTQKRIARVPQYPDSLIPVHAMWLPSTEKKILCYLSFLLLCKNGTKLNILFHWTFCFIVCHPIKTPAVLSALCIPIRLGMLIKKPVVLPQLFNWQWLFLIFLDFLNLEFGNWFFCFFFFGIWF